jgi:uncharacterized protein YggE
MEDMRRFLFIALAAAVVIAAAAISGIGQPAPARGDTMPPRLVTTTGHGVVTAVPDDVTVTAGVQTQSTTAADTLAQNSAAMNKVVAALQQAGGQKLQTQQVSLYPRTNDAGDVIGYAAQDSVSAHSDVAGAGALIDAAVGAGANTVDGPTLALSNQDALYNQALQKALTDARTKAEALGQAGSFSVGPVSSITEESDETAPVVFKAAATAGAAPSTPIEPGTQDVTADVTVVFEIQ